MPRSPRTDEILRFRKSERHLHWAVAVPFMVSFLSALILVTVYNAHPDGPWRVSVSLVHKISGICLILLPLATVLWHRHDWLAHWQNVRQAWRWSWNDLRWLFLMAPAAVSRKVTLPHQGKFNAAEKINFMVLTSTYPLYVVTGLLIWMPGIAIVAWFLHFGMAIIATPLLLGHIFMATINRDTRTGLSGMTTGFVDREWARHHYRLWYDEHYGDRPSRTLPAEPTPSGVPTIAAPAAVPQPPAPAAGVPRRRAYVSREYRVTPPERARADAG
jgi:formate dehydrogenase subunit gamma